MIPSALFQADGCVGEYVGEYVGECVASITKDRILIQDPYKLYHIKSCNQYCCRRSYK